MALPPDCGLVLCSSLAELIKENRPLSFVYCKGLDETDEKKLAQGHVSLVADDTPLENFLPVVQRAALPPEPILLICYEANGVHKSAYIWWRLKCLGRSSVAVLEGGAEAWKLFPSSQEIMLPTVPQSEEFPYSRVDHYLKSEAEVEEQKSVPGWEYQFIITEKKNSIAGLHFEPNLVFTSIGRFEEPGFLREIVTTAGINLSDTCQSIVFGANAATVLLGLAILGKRNLCLGVSHSADAQQSPRANFSIDKDDFFTACGDDEFFDALSESRRESVFVTAAKGEPEMSGSGTTATISGPKTDLKRLIPNSGGSGELQDAKTHKSCQCLLM